MANYNFDEIIDRTGTDSMKYDAGRVYNPDLPEKHIPMWVADMDFACPQPMLDAMHERLNRRILGYANYTSTLGDNYFEAVCGWLKRRHNIDAKKENISFAEGVINAAYALVDCMTTVSYTHLHPTQMRANMRHIPGKGGCAALGVAKLHPKGAYHDIHRAGQRLYPRRALPCGRCVRGCAAAPVQPQHPHPAGLFCAGGL